MKTLASTSSASSSRSTRPVATSSASTSPYLSTAQTKALFASSLTSRLQRLESPDMLSTQEAAEQTGTTRVTINAWIAKGRAIGLTQTRRGFRLPSWQFEPTVWDALPQVTRALGTHEGWAILSFMETPLGALNGLTPRHAIEQGHLKRVVELAAAEGT